MPFASLLAALGEIRDPRRPQGRRYTLAHLLLFSILAVLAGAASYQSIITFMTVHRVRLNTDLRRSLPARSGCEHLTQPLPGARPSRSGSCLSSPRASPR